MQIQGKLDVLSKCNWQISRHCKYLLKYEVSEPPNYWMHSMLRCDGKCDAEDQLEIPFRVSPAVSNPPREYRKKVRVIDFKNDAYLNTAMNESINKYQACLNSLGYPSNIPQHVKGIQSDEIETSKENLPVTAEEVIHRSCGVITTFITQCMPILNTCLSTSNAEIIRAKDAKWIVSQLNITVSEIKNMSFHPTQCQVLGGKVSSVTSPRLELFLLGITTLWGSLNYKLYWK